MKTRKFEGQELSNYKKRKRKREKTRKERSIHKKRIEKKEKIEGRNCSIIKKGKTEIV